MPIVVNPGYVWPPETDPVVSPDGRITAIVDPAHAGVLLRADFDDSVPDTPAQPEKVLRRNLLPNPSFENGDEGMASAGANRNISTTWSSTGKNSLQVTNANSGTANPRVSRDQPFDPERAGRFLAFGAKATRSVADSWGRLGIQFRENGTWKNPYLGPWQNIPWPDNGAGLLAHAVEIPEGADYLHLRFQFAKDGAGAPWPESASIRTDDWVVVVADTQSEALDAVATYFDGSTATSGTKRYRWTGPVNASASEEFTPATPFIPGHDATVARVRFERQDGSVVRSGNPAWAPGGYAHAYDHEATLGGGTLWRAVPIRFDGTEGEPSEYVGAVIPALSDGWAWLKPVADPDKAMLLKVEPPDLSYDGRVDTTSIAGTPRPAATWDVLEGFTTQLRSLVREKNVEEQLMALLDEGPVLAQFPACAGLPDFYFIRGKLDLEHVHWDGWPWRRYQWDVIQIDRPDTTDSPLRIPGLSYDTVERDWTTYDQLAATVTSYNQLLEP